MVVGDIYRGLLNAFAGSVHAVHEDNVVVAGSLSGFSFLTPYGRLGIAPLVFLRKLLCMSAGRVARPTCKTKVDLDAVSIHPWTSGSPIHHASEKDDISLGDLPELRRLVDAAFRAGQIRSKAAPHIWITEFAWDTRPPDPNPLTAPLALQARWVSEAIHQAWKNKVRVFTWLQLWDQLYTEPLQSGLFFRNGENFRDARPKPAFYAFRFPFVAYRNGQRRLGLGTHAVRAPGQGRGAAQDRCGLALGGNVDRRPLRGLPGTCALQETAEAAGVPSHRERQHVPRPGRIGVTDVVLAARRARRHDGLGPDQDERRHVHGGREARRPRPDARTTAASFDGKTAAGEARPDRPGSTRSSSGPRRGRPRTPSPSATATRTTSSSPSAPWAGWRTRRTATPSSRARSATGSGTTSCTRTTRPRPRGRSTWTESSRSSPSGSGWRAERTRASRSTRRCKSYFGGQIAQVAVYPYVLSPAQVKSHYQATGRRVAPDTPLGFLRALQVGSNTTSLPFSRPPTRPLRPALRPRREPAIGRPAEEG